MKTDQEISQWLEDRDLSAVIPDGFPQAFLGIVRTDSEEGVVRAVYSRQGVIEGLMAHGMNREEATEFFEFNVAGAYVEDGPLFVETP